MISSGDQKVFDYPSHFSTMPDYSEIRGRVVTVIRQLTDEEADQGDGMEKMYKVSCEGVEYEAFESELKNLSE